MTKYRIIEKKGEYKPAHLWSGEYLKIHGAPKEDQLIYFPRYIVQEIIYKGMYFWVLMLEELKDLKEFTNLEEARKFKRDLELEEGIVIE